MMTLENIEAEASVLGSVLIDGTFFKELEVQEDHFYSAKHKRIFRAMKQVSEHGEFIDIVVVTTNLGKDINEVGGTTYLLEMAESVASTASLKSHERLVFDAYRTRKSREQALTFADNPTDQGLDELINTLQAYREIGTDKREKSTYDHLVEITEEMCFPTSGHSGFITSFKELDDMTGGFQRGDLIIIAARPSVGKTAFALSLASGHCKNGGTSSIFSLEMGTKQLLQRMISSESMIDSQKWRSMAFSMNDYEKALRAIGIISNWKLNSMDKKRTISDIRSSIRKIVNDDPESNHLAIIDYLQLITPATKRERRDLEIGEITRELKLLAMELNIPIILLSQLSRGVESRQDKRPLMSDLRESGNIEQDADVISFLYRDDYYRKDAPKKNHIEIIISKQRNGPTGTVDLAFYKEFGRFDNGTAGLAPCPKYLDEKRELV